MGFLMMMMMLMIMMKSTDKYHIVWDTGDGVPDDDDDVDEEYRQIRYR